MKSTRSFDIILNVLFPVGLGYFIYYMTSQTTPTVTGQLIKNYIPDGLWAWSFISAILILWHRKVNYTWVVITYLLTAGFELLQLLEIMPGTADLVDIMVYFLFMSLALFANSFFRKRFPAPSTTPSNP